MNKRVQLIMGISILAIMIISTIITLTGLINGKIGDYIIMGSSVIIGIIMIILIRKKRDKN